MPGSTVNYGWSYPLSTDPPNGASQIQTLATAIDTALKATNDAVALRSLSTHNHDSTYAKGYVAALSSGTDVEETVTGSSSPFTCIGTFAATSGRHYLIAGSVRYGNNAAVESSDDFASADIELWVNGSLLDLNRTFVVGSYNAQDVDTTFAVPYTAGTTGNIEVKYRLTHRSSSGRSTIYDARWAVYDLR